MIFQITIDSVLSKKKCQTSRLWDSDNYQITGYRDSGNGMQISEISSIRENALGNTRKLYYLGQTLSAQPKRGAKGVAKIRILELAKRDVRNFDTSDIAREGFESFQMFLGVWVGMHDTQLWRKIANLTGDIRIAVQHRPAEFYEALVIRFELVQEKQS